MGHTQMYKLNCPSRWFQLQKVLGAFESLPIKNIELTDYHVRNIKRYDFQFSELEDFIIKKQHRDMVI